MYFARLRSGRCGEMADAQDLKSWDPKKSCRFESDHRHHSELIFFLSSRDRNLVKWEGAVLVDLLSILNSVKLSRKAIGLLSVSALALVPILVLVLVLTTFTGTDTRGIAFKPDGTPAGRVSVYIVGSTDGVYIQGPPLTVCEGLQGRTRKSITDKAGRFSFRRRNNDHSIVLFDESGFAQMRVDEFVKTHEIFLRPWARVEGKLIVGGKPLANESVRLWPAYLPYEDHPRELPPLSLFLNTRSKADGTFVFERVPPIKVEVYHSPIGGRKNTSGIIPRSQSQKLVLKPGATTQVILGGKGRPVVGRVVLKNYEGNFNWRDDTYTMVPNPPLPAGLPDLLAEAKRFSKQAKAAMGKSINERKAIFDKFEAEQKQDEEKARVFYQSEAGWSYYAAQSHYVMRFQEDGRFRIEDVPGGPYAINLQLRDATGRFIATVEKSFEIPESPGGRIDEPFDVGTIEVSTRTQL